MIGRGLLSSPWLATEYISDTPLTAQEKIEKLSAFHTLLLAGYSFPSGGRRTPGTRQDEDPLGLPVAGCRETAPEKILKSSRLADYQEAVRNLIYDTSITAGQ